MTTDIKPDTSLYPYNSPEFYMAMAEIVKRGGEIECRSINQRGTDKAWSVTSEISSIIDWDHRLKPEPRVVWVNFYEGGEAYHYNDEGSARHAAARRRSDNIGIAVRVELPE